MARRFWKLESIGNDFPLIHLEEGLDYANLAIRMADRHFGIGGDGLLAVGMEDDAVRLRMFNPDGTEDFCGNGIRIAALHAHQQGWVGTSFSIKHLDREVPIQIEGDVIKSQIGVASYDPDLIPARSSGEPFDVNIWTGMDAGTPLSIFGSALTTGSTHTVIPTAALPDDETFKSISSKIEVDVKFPDRTSVIWSREVEPNVLEIRIWERGVGETLGCGTGSSAAAVDYLRRKQRGGRVEVRNPGGTIFVTMDKWSAPITIEGTAREVYSGEFMVGESTTGATEPVSVP